jgi:hypothetical protein
MSFLSQTFCIPILSHALPSTVLSLILKLLISSSKDLHYLNLSQSAYSNCPAKFSYSFSFYDIFVILCCIPYCLLLFISLFQMSPLILPHESSVLLIYIHHHTISYSFILPHASLSSNLPLTSIICKL